MFREPASEKRRDDRWETLKRRVQLLSRLMGKPVLLAEGIHVGTAQRVTDADRLVTRLRERGVLDRATFEKVFASERPLTLVTRQVLATAHRDLRALAAPPSLALARDRRRALARFGDIDEAWLKRTRDHVDALASTISISVPREPEEWFDAVVDIVGMVHGAESAKGLHEARVRLTSLGAERRRIAQERIEALLRALDTGEPPEDADLLPLVERLDRARELPGRARRTRALDVLRKTLAWPEAPAAAAHDLALPLRDKSFSEALREAGLAMVRALPAARDPAFREKALGMLAFYGLTFRVAGGGVPLLSAEDVDRALAKKEPAQEISGADLTFAQAIAVVDLPLSKFLRRRVAGFVAEGLEVDLVARTCKEGQGEALARAPSMRAARAYATWATRLVPHYKSLGITFELSPDLFTHLPRNEDVAVLAVCLMEQARAGNANANAARVDPIAILDATLGIFSKLPVKAAGILERLKGTTPGSGRKAFPDLAEWLGDDSLLDRFVHLARVAAAPVALGKQLREDFEHAEKAARERAHLEGLPSRSSRQEARLTTLRATTRTLATAPRGRTRRRLLERIDELLPIAYRRELDGAFREIMRDAWGITIPTLTQAWRDAVRFWLVVDDNRELLGRLLREAAAAPRQDVTLVFVKNREWIAKNQPQLRIDRWLAPRRHEIDVEGTKLVLATEEDPLEVLRMGIPFGTCLALETGCNAASTVLNAIDANKRVLYVRNRDGKVVARKLIAITKESRIVGYNLYVSMTGPAERAIRLAFDAMCRAISDDVGAPLAGSGVPEEIHKGFWYDDGTVPWGEDVDVAAYCHALELEAPPKWFDAIATEARGRAAMDSGDVDAAIAVLTRWDGGPANLGLGRWLVERLGERETVRRAKEQTALAPALLRAMAVSGEDGMLRALAASTRLDEYSAANTLPALLAAFPRSDRLSKGVADAAARAMRVFPRSNDHGLVHATMNELDDYLDGIATSFDALDVADRAWYQYTRIQKDCDACRRGAWDRTIATLQRIYRRAPDPDAVVACLMSRHRGILAQRSALHIAASHVLPNGTRALSRLAALRPHYATSGTMLAARLRQDGVTSITEALARKIPRPKEAPFEDLAEQLFTCRGIERVLEEWPAVEGSAADTWTPGSWELAYLRRRPDAKIRDDLFTVAARTPGVATRAMELLAQLGDLTRLEELRLLALETNRTRLSLPPSEGAKTREPPKVVEPKEWKSVFDCHTAAQATSVQVAATCAGTLPPAGIGRRDTVDRSLVALAVEKLSDITAPQQERDVALDAIAAGRSGNRLWDDLLVTLAGQHDHVGLRRVLEDKITDGRWLRPDVIVAVWQVEESRLALTAALAKNADDDWSARATACERLAVKTEVDADGLFEGWALAIVENGAASTAAETETLDQLRTVIRMAVTKASPVRAIALYEELLDDLSASLFVKAVRKLPRDRAAALRDAAGKAPFRGGERATARKAWILATRPLKKSRSSSIERE